MLSKSDDTNTSKRVNFKGFLYTIENFVKDLYLMPENFKNPLRFSKLEYL